jgi:hypothetical protein
VTGTIRLIHWNAGEAGPRAERLRALGYAVNDALPNGPSLLKELAQEPPAALVIDLSRLPSQGRDVALSIRERKASRRVPLVFVGGEPEKVERVRELLPDAVYTTWDGIEDALHEAIAHPPANPVVPESSFAGYAGKPLPEKLGIRTGSVVGLLGAPPGFADQLGVLPPGARLQWDATGGCTLLVWFVRTPEELHDRIDRLAAALERGSLWIVWPKRATGLARNLSQQHVRNVGMGAGLVDYKICSVDDTWSGLLFARRDRAPKGKAPAELA